MDGYRAAAAHLDATEQKAASSRTASITASEPAKITDSRDESVNLIELRILTIETQLASLAAAVRQLSDRVSEIEQKITSPTEPHADHPAPQLIRLCGIGTSPAYYLRSLASGLNAFVTAFKAYKQSEQSIIPGISEDIGSMAERVISMARACENAWPNPASK